MVVRRVIAVIGALTALLGAACGGSDGQIRAVADPEVSALVGVLISGAFSAFPMSGPGFTALVDGGWPGLPDRPAVIRYQKEGQSEPTVVAMPGGDRRALVYAWWTGDAVAVLSTACPRWGEGLRPVLDEDEPAWLARGCGSSAVDLWHWTPTDRKWKEVAPAVFDAPAGYGISAPRGEQVIVTVTPDPSMAGQQVAAPMLKIDAAKGSVTTLPGHEVFTAASQVEPCLLADGSLVVAVAPNASPVAASGEGQPSVEPPPAPGAPAVRVLALDADRWRDVDVPKGENEQIGGCTTDHQVVIAGDGAVLTLASPDGGTTRIKDPPGKSIEIQEYGIGSVLAVVDDEDAPAEPMPATAYLLAQGDWTQVGSIDPSKQNSIYVVDDQVLTVPVPSSADEQLRIGRSS